MYQIMPSNKIDLLNEEIRAVKCAQYGLMSLSESAYITDPVMRPYAILEAKSIIRYGISVGHYPRYYSKFLDSDDVISLRLATTAPGEMANRKLNESLGVDLALGIGQMIPGVKTFAGIAGVAYYATQAYNNFSAGSTFGGIGNLFLTLLSAAAIEPLGATSFVGPIVTALGPLTKLGKAFESFLGLIIKGAFAPLGKLLVKFPPLKAFVGWVEQTGMKSMDDGVGWLAGKADDLAGWLSRKGTDWAGKPGAEGTIAKVAQFLAKKVGSAAQTMSKFITNLKTFITTGGATWATKAEVGAAKAEVGAAGAVTKAATAEARAAVKAADDAYKSLVNAQFKTRPDLAAKYAGNEAMILDDIAKGSLTNVNSFELRKAAESLSAAKAGMASAEAAAAKAGTGAIAPAGVEGAAAAAPTTQTTGALKNLGSAMYADLRSFHSALDKKIGELLTKAESAQIKSATRSMVGNPVKFRLGDGRIAKVIYADAKTGKVFKTLLDPRTKKMGAPVETSIMDLMKTNMGRSKLAEAGLNPDRFTAIARGLARGFSSGAGQVPEAEAAAGL